MKLQLLLLLVVGSAVAEDWDINDIDDIGVFGIDSRIAGGNPVSNSTDYKYQVAIEPIRNGTTSGVTCTGVLITMDAVLTAGRCALSGDSYWIQVGRLDLSLPSNESNRRRALAQSTTVHEEFLSSYLTSDLAIIRLDTPFDPTNCNCEPVTLPTVKLSENSFLARKVNMAGWGYPNAELDTTVAVLRSLDSYVVPNFYCAIRHLSLPIKSTHICTAGFPNKGPCTGDAGSPLMVSDQGKRYLIGIATYTPAKGCMRGKPGVFTRLTKYLNWIEANANIVVLPE